MSKGRNSSGQFSKGNTCAKGNKGKGKYKKAYIDELILYFSAEPKPGVEYPMFEGFAKKIGVTVRTLERWATENEDFGEAYERCRDVQRRFLVLGGLTERYNSAFAKFMCGVHGMSDKNATVERDDPTGASGGLDVVITLLSEREKDDGEKKA
jgi:hypothetical protein